MGETNSGRGFFHKKSGGQETEPKAEKPHRFSVRKIFKKKWIKALIAIILIIALIPAGIKIMSMQKSQSKETTVRTATVEKQTIQSSISSSGTLEAKDTYNLTALVSGEVITADFEEGDQVEKGNVLYRIDTDSIDQKINTAQTTLERAQKKYTDAQSDYDKAAKDYQTLNYSSKESGYIKTLFVEAGDSITKGAKIADIYNDKTMVLKVPFLSTAADQISIGATANIQILETNDTLSGKVTAISSMEQTVNGGAIVRIVSIDVSNPGGLTTSNTASVEINGVKCSGDGSFTAKLEKTITADYGGDVAKLSVDEGSYIAVGGTLFTLTSDSAADQLKSLKNSMDTAKQSLEDAQTSLQNQQDNLSDYEITAPISGQVIAKSVKAGDNLNNNSNSTTLAVIYDMSALTFQMSVDELDILNVEVGQTVQVSADAVENTKFTGKVTNVSLEGTSGNGVTQYPVTVTLDETGDLIPGMNVNGEIIIAEAKDAVSIPAQALIRGNTVYIKDDSVKEADGKVPAGFRSVKVETGLISEDYVEIKSGLSEGDVVYINSTTSSESTSMSGMMGGMPSGGGMPGGGAPGGGMPTGGGGGNGMARSTTRN